MAVSERFRRQAEPKLLPIEVGINAAEAMRGIEAILEKRFGPLKHRAVNYGKNKKSLCLPFRHEGSNADVIVNIHEKKGIFSKRKSMSVLIQHPDKTDPSKIRNDKLKMKWSRGQQEPMHITGKIKTNLGGVRNKNNETSVQHAQRFIALLG